MWGYFDGYLGYGCNERLDSSVCYNTGQARGACFASFMMVLMVHALTCKHDTKSVFQMKLWDNKTLLVSVVVIILSVFPIIYIPVINNDVFLLGDLHWEWGMVFASQIIYLALAELYKVVRRHFERKHQRERLALMEQGDQPSAALETQHEKNKVANRGEKAV